MDQLKKLIATLSWPQRAGILAVALLSVGAILGLVHWRHEQDFRPLFTGMSPEDAAAVVQKLKEGGIEYRIAGDGSTVLAPAEKIDELRLEMAGAGLPKSGRAGFELFDKTNLGITDFAEHVNYERALEGELERSIKTLSEVEQARVHITFPKDSVLLPQNVQAITNLVASAVQGLTPDNVSVVDMQGNLLSRPRKALLDETGMSDALLEYKHEVEKDLAAKVEATLEPLLGAGKFRVGVSADCDFTTTDQSDEVLDPTRSVMVTSQKTEDVTGSAQNSGVPGTASNLPRSPAAARPAATPMSASRRTESVSYETSRTVRHIKIPQGSIKRISAALLLDQDVQWQGSGKQRKRVLVPPSPDKLKAIHDVVAGVLGLDPQRGDQLVIESLPFEQTLSGSGELEEPEAGPKPAPNPLHLPLNGKTILIGAGALIVLAAGALLLLRKKKRPAVTVSHVPVLPHAASAAAGPPGLAAAGTAESAVSASASATVTPAAEPPVFRLQLPPQGQKIEALRTSMKEIVQKDPAIAAGVLRGWIEEGEQ